jgi:hypothetical protein
MKATGETGTLFNCLKISFHDLLMVIDFCYIVTVLDYLVLQWKPRSQFTFLCQICSFVTVSHAVVVLNMASNSLSTFQDSVLQMFCFIKVLLCVTLSFTEWL